ncbi:FtsK/SpoIIIE domain-containing protein [Catenuloplanes atrovinosus]|uniref:FtsK domain-containing protein n=1 Tax=Catenuloplanes atrovinosus TaxID=137266 RepID=A0AAE4CDE0_9ACTN|nr:FtsK/SpoIIIE domain-containing protein [Catenuloplanes atrovinosus]MDR7280287.1 hypothetical protein [Catenuloplanes atrovinosus]
MADDETDVSRAAALHRQAAAVLAAADAGLHALTPAPSDLQAQRSLAERLSKAAALLAPGWLGANLATGRVPAEPSPGVPAFVRVGTARPLPEAGFPAVVPLAGAGHLTVDADGRDPRTAALLRAVLLRLVASAAPGSLLVRAVDGADEAVFAAFAPLADAGLMPPPATDPAGLRAILDEAEQWIRLRTPEARTPEARRQDTRGREAQSQTRRADARSPEVRHPEPREDVHPRSRNAEVGAARRVESRDTETRATDARRHEAQGPEPHRTEGHATEVEPEAHGAGTRVAGARHHEGQRLEARNADTRGAGPRRHEGHVPVGLSADARMPDTRPTDLRGGDARRPEQRKRDDNRLLIVIVASFPAGADPIDLLRFRDLATRGPAAGLHLLVAGWPPPALATGLPAQPLPLSTPITLREAYAIVGDPPGDSFAAQPNDVGLNSPVLLDGDPPAEMLAAVCRRLAAGFLAFERPSLRDLLPAELWAEDATEGLATVVGRDGERTVAVQLNDLAPHWLIGGRAGAGKSAFLTAALAGLTARYSPDDLALYLVQPTGHAGDQTGHAGDQTGEGPPPHVRATGDDILDRLVEELDRRAALAARHGTTRFADLRAVQPLPRIVCVIDEFVPLLQARPGLLEPLTAISRGARSCGIHLVLTTRTPRAIPALHERDGLFAQWTVRIALPGGGGVLEPTNESAQSLPAGTAVINTAGGLGGPRNATRGHERLVRFPNPRADRKALSELHSRLHARAAEPPAVLLGRPAVPRDAATPPPPVAFPLGGGPGRHLAIIGSAPQAPDLLHAATRSLSAHHAPGTARFLVCPLIPDADRHADALTAALARRHEVEQLDAAGLTKALELDEPAYLVVFGLDAGDRVTLPPDRLTHLLRTGPAKGVHLLSWWRGTHRLTGDLSGAAARIDGLALLDLPADEVTALVGDPGEQAGALLHDRRTGTTTAFIPFRTEPAKPRTTKPETTKPEVTKTGTDTRTEPLLPAPRSTVRPAEARET